MATVLLMNVGLRDVLLNGQRIERPREDGQRLRAEWPAVASSLSLPIIEPMVRYMRDVLKSLPDSIVLYATDQAEAAPEHADRDTLHLAELAKLMLERDPKQRVRVRKIQRENPSLYDEMLRFFLRELDELDRKTPGGVDRCFVAPVGGIPAANTGLLLAAVHRFGEAATVLYQREGALMPEKLDAGRLLYLNTLRQIAEQQVRAYQFAAAVPLLRQIEGAEEPCCAQLAEYCNRRLNFDFRGALEIADKAYTRAGSARRRLLDRAITEAKSLDEANHAASLLVELAHNMNVAYTNGAYRDYLTRLVSFEEAAARLIVEKHLPPLSYRDNDGKAQKRRLAEIALRPDLKDYLDSQKRGGQPLRYEQANTTVLLALVDYLADDQRPNRPPEWTMAAEDTQALREARETLEWLEKLNRARNAAVHKHGGASAELITNLYRQAAQSDRDLSADVWRLVDIVTGSARTRWLVDEIRDAIVAQICA